MSPRIFLTLWLMPFLCGLLCFAGRQSMAADSVEAVLLDGRHVTGVVDAETNLNQLWLRRDEPSLKFASGFPWDQVLRGQVADQTFSRDELKVWAMANKQAGRLLLDLIPSPDARQQNSQEMTPSTASSGPVKTLAIEAYLAQWDSDVQPDGIRVFVSPLDAQGHLVAVDGRIEYTLVIEDEKLNGGQNGPLRPVFRELDRGSCLVRRDHFAAGAAVYELPFTQQHPDVDANISRQALLYVRLAVPGQGVFEASDAQVCLRERSRFRDQLQYYTPQRYLSIESGGQPHR